MRHTQPLGIPCNFTFCRGFLIAMWFGNFTGLCTTSRTVPVKSCDYSGCQLARKSFKPGSWLTSSWHWALLDWSLVADLPTCNSSRLSVIIQEISDLHAPGSHPLLSCMGRCFALACQFLKLPEGTNGCLHHYPIMELGLRWNTNLKTRFAGLFVEPRQSFTVCYWADLMLLLLTLSGYFEFAMYSCKAVHNILLLLPHFMVLSYPAWS